MTQIIETKDNVKLSDEVERIIERTIEKTIERLLPYCKRREKYKYSLYENNKEFIDQITMWISENKDKKYLICSDYKKTLKNVPGNCNRLFGDTIKKMGYTKRSIRINNIPQKVWVKI